MKFLSKPIYLLIISLFIILLIIALTPIIIFATPFVFTYAVLELYKKPNQKCEQSKITKKSFNFPKLNLS
jgi:hypothetical protein